MSNTATYLNQTQKQKLRKIAQDCEVSESRVLQVIVDQMQFDYLVELVNNYKNQVGITQA